MAMPGVGRFERRWVSGRKWRYPVKHSSERILTTHTGSLPRPMELARMLEAKDAGESVDDASLAQQAREAVADTVRKQVEAGIDVVSDGEQGKVGYSTYPRHRLTGFGGVSSAPARADWADFPEAAKRSRRVVHCQPARLQRTHGVGRPCGVQDRHSQLSGGR